MEEKSGGARIMKTAAEYIVAEIMDTIERERRINKDDLVLAAEIAIRKHEKAALDANPIVGMVVDRCTNPGVYTYGGAAERERQAVEQWLARNKPASPQVLVEGTPTGDEKPCSVHASGKHLHYVGDSGEYGACACGQHVDRQKLEQDILGEWMVNGSSIQVRFGNDGAYWMLE